MMQQNLIQDTKEYIHFITIGIAIGSNHEFAYKLTDGSNVSDILAINDHDFLVDKRDGSGLGWRRGRIEKLYKIDLAQAGCLLKAK